MTEHAVLMASLQTERSYRRHVYTESGRDPVMSRDGFCNACQNLLFSRCLDQAKAKLEYQQMDLEVHHASVQQLHIAVQNDCPICTTVFHQFCLSQRLEDACWPRLSSSHRSLRVTSSAYTTAILIALSWRSVSLEGEQNFHIEFDVRKLVDIPPLPPLIEEEDPMCTGSVDLRPWLSQCLSHHKCDKGRNQNYMPPRVLDCRDSSLRLFDRTTVVKQNFRRGYATLSHCWGGAPMKFMLTTDNLEDCYKAINMTDLPKTFQGAIQVVRRADINFVWIDSLCIVQAGPLHSADWQMHVTEMSEIYTNCILNIAAAHSTNSNGGCFVQRSNANLSVTFMQNVIKSCNESYAIIPKYYGSHAKQPLNRRAWVYQERLLSPRIIHYTESDVWWECAECYLPSTFYYGLPSTYKSVTNMYPPWDPDGKFRVEFSWEPREMVDYGLNERQADDLTHWKRTVEWYSQLDITYDGDVFPAIGAIASRLNEHVYCTDYIAGFFKSDLPQSLIFERHTTKARSVYVAPSWSWASAQGEIKFIGAPGVPTAVIKSIETRLVNARNKLGQLLSASITLDTHVLRLTFDPTMWQHLDGYSARDPNIESELWNLSRDGAEVMKLHSESSFYLRWDDPKRLKHLELHLIRIFRDDGLIVVPASIPEAFERVGTWTIRFWKRSGILIVKEALFRRRFKRTAIALV